MWQYIQYIHQSQPLAELCVVQQSFNKPKTSRYMCKKDANDL